MCLRKWCFFRGDFAGEVPETKCFALKSCGLFLPIFLSVSEFSGKTFVSVPRPVAVMATKLGGFIISIEIKYHGSCSIYFFSRCCKFACFSFKHVVCWYPNKETWWFESNVRPSDTMMMMMMMMMVMMTIPTSKRCSSITGKPWKTHCFLVPKSLSPKAMEVCQSVSLKLSHITLLRFQWKILWRLDTLALCIFNLTLRPAAAQESEGRSKASNGWPIQVMVRN